MGQAPTGDSYNARGEGLPLIAGAGDFKGQSLAPTKFTTKPGKISKPGDIVLSIRASIGAKVWADGEYCLGRGVAGLRAGPELDEQYLWHWLTRYERDLASKGRGATFLQVNKTDIGEMPIMVPALAEQRRIAAILDHADALRAKRRQVLAHLDALTRSIFNEMFSGGGFECVALREAIKWRSGKFLPAKEQKPGAHPVFGGNGVNGSHDDYMFEEPRLVVGRVGAYCGAVHLTKPFSWVTDNALIATLLRDDLTLDYLLPALSLANLNQYAGVSGQPSISAGKIGDASIPVPPPELQRTFADRVAKIEIQTAVTRTAESTASDLLASLQSRAFRGEL